MIKDVNLNDVNEFYCLGKCIKDNFDNLYNLDDIINSSNDFVFGYYDNKLVGFLHITKSFEVVDIVNIVVDENYRRQGIATKLINYIVNNFEDINSIMLDVNENNESAINTYLKNDFVEINRRKKYYGNDDAIIMKRDV